VSAPVSAVRRASDGAAGHWLPRPDPCQGASATE
jgi:hypothetical protein